MPPRKTTLKPAAVTPQPIPATQLRQWQTEALGGFMATARRDYLVSATPGAGKTTFVVNLAATLWAKNKINRFIIVVPTDHLRTQWITAAKKFGFDLRDTPNNEALPVDAHGCVVTYAQVAQHPALHARRTTDRRTMVAFDEIHHAGDDKSWGQAVMGAFEEAVLRFGVTGTPFRSDDAQIAHVRYRLVPETGVRISDCDYTYSYGDALRDGVVRPVMFATYAGSAQWFDSAGDVQSAILGDPTLTRVAEERAWRTALDAEGQWLPHVMAAAWQKVQGLRASTIPDAKVLIPAANQEVARAYAVLWERVTGETPTLILSDDKEAGAQLAAYRDDPARVTAVCVRMVTEGVDVPAAAVLLYTTTASTPLFFAQMVGRVVRARNRREVATVFLPAVSHLVGLAAEMEVERNHYIAANPDDEGDDDDPVEREEAGTAVTWRPQASQATLGDVTLGADVADLLGLEGLLTPEQEKALLARDEQQRAEEAKKIAAEQAALRLERETREGLERAHERARVRRVEDEQVARGTADAKVLRARCAASVSGLAAARGISHAEAWALLYREVPGPKNATASTGLLWKRLRWLETH